LLIQHKLFAEAPSEIISITSPSSTEFAAGGRCESTSPAAELELQL
jgi:hypothetical protein